MTGFLTDASLAEFEEFLGSNLHQGMWRFEKDLRTFVQQHGWEAAFPLVDKFSFAESARSIYIFAARRSHQAMRFQQLLDGLYPIWVYRSSGCEAHADLDGIAIPVGHPFWVNHFPANGWRCSCEVYGARNEKGIVRVGGDPSKPLPNNWTQLNPATGMPWGIDRGFSGQVHPDIKFCIEGMMRGHLASN